MSESVPPRAVDGGAAGAAPGRYRVYVMDVSYFSGKLEDYAYPTEAIAAALKNIPAVAGA